MKADITVTGKVIAKYQLPKDEVDELNEIFDQKKFNLKSHSDSLAGMFIMYNLIQIQL